MHYAPLRISYSNTEPIYVQYNFTTAETTIFRFFFTILVCHTLPLILKEVIHHALASSALQKLHPSKGVTRQVRALTSERSGRMPCALFRRNFRDQQTPKMHPSYMYFGSFPLKPLCQTMHIHDGACTIKRIVIQFRLNRTFPRSIYHRRSGTSHSSRRRSLNSVVQRMLYVCCVLSGTVLIN